MLYLSKAIISLILGFILSIVLGVILLPILKKVHASQNVSRHLNERHLKKEGTPTFGGFIFILSVLIIMVVHLVFKNIYISYNFFILIFTFLSYAFLGFIDDYLKVKYKNNKGLSIITKFLFEVIIALIFFIFFIISGNITTISFFNITIDLKFLYGIFILFMLTGSSNAVNITDGLDGLAAGCSLISFLTYGIIAFNRPEIIANEEIAIFCFTLSGSLLGFLFYNFYPAKVFMGDLGSLALGSVLATVAILLKCELSLIVIGIVYIIETLTSMVQIISIKLFNKKVFRKSPFHHNLEEYNMAETDILKIFYMIGFIFSLLALIYYVWI